MAALGKAVRKDVRQPDGFAAHLTCVSIVHAWLLAFYLVLCLVLCPLLAPALILPASRPIFWGWIKAHLAICL